MAEPVRTHRVSAGGRPIVLAAENLLPYLLRLLSGGQRRVLAAVFIIDPRPEEDPDGTVRSVLDQLARAEWRGTDVRVLVGGSVRMPAIELAGRVTCAYMESLGVSCRQFAGIRGETSLHSKYVVVDDTVVVGSHNWTRRALCLDNELSLAIASPDLARSLSLEFERHWQRAAEPVAGGDGA